MTNYTQTDPRWATLVFDDGLKYGPFGCFVTSLGNMVDMNPADTAERLRNGGGLVGGLIQSEKAAQILGLEYHGRSTTKPNYDCIAETNYYDKASTNAVEQHFFILKADGSQVDPLGKNIKYPIVSYRLFKAKGDLMAYDLFRQNGRDEIYERHSDRSLVHLTPEDYNNQYNSKAPNQVDDINSAGTIIPQTVTKEVPGPERVVTNTIYVDKPVPVEVDTLTDEEIKTVTDQYVKDHPPVVETKTEYVTRDMTVGEALSVLWSAVKNIKIRKDNNGNL